MKLNHRERRFVIGGLFAATLFGVAQFIVLPRWERIKSGSGGLFQAEKELRSDRELIAAKQIREQEAALRARLDEQNRRLLSAPDANQAGAEFQTWLAAGAAQQQLGFVRSEFLAPVVVGDKYVRIPVRLELTGRITQITQFLASITTSDRIVAIEELDLSSSSDKEKRIHCGLVAAALMAKGNKK
jgi:Tfp pilus assembly protein PilO